MDIPHLDLWVRCESGEPVLISSQDLEMQISSLGQYLFFETIVSIYH